jgi:hypothetical protein
MSEWITDRLPKYEDGLIGLVWYQEINGTPHLRRRNEVKLGMPWMPIKEPEPYKPEPTRWKPKDMERYFCIFPSTIIGQAWLNEKGDYDRWAMGNCFATYNEAAAALGKVKELLLSLHLGDEHDKS